MGAVIEKRGLHLGIVGAGSLIGKELAEELGRSTLAAEVALLDAEEVSGRITALADEAAFIRRIETASFDHMDLCFFAGSIEQTLRHWKTARKAGARIVDLTGALLQEPASLVLAPWLPQSPAQPRTQPGFATPAVVPAHPVATILALIADRCAAIGLLALAATVLEPASERGQAGLDEMHRQIVSLLSFQPVPKDEFDTQVAFNVLSTLGDLAKTKISDTTQRIRDDYRRVVAGHAAELTLQLVHAPVFHGSTASVLLEFAEGVTPEVVERALDGPFVNVVRQGSEPPSNLSAAGQGEILVQVSQETARRLWLWLAADNLRIRAVQAIACAIELVPRKPQGLVQ